MRAGDWYTFNGGLAATRYSQGLRHRHVVRFAVAFAVAVPLLAPWAGPTRAFLLGFDIDARDGRHSERVTKALSKVVPSSSIRRLIFGAYA